jgi:NAD(P)-dependent dehydrogenase (short-subunit alcohol dehydrogenase family)
MRNISKPKIFITGASSGIGMEFVRQYLKEGCRVFATYRNDDTASSLKSLKGDLQLFHLDIRKIKDIERVRNCIKSECIDVLINNAAIHGPEDRLATFGQIDVKSWSDLMQTNVFYTVKLTEMLFDLVRKSREKKIVFISSRAGSISERGKLPHHLSGGTYIYRSSKAALNAVTQSLAFDYTPQGISVIVLHPGWVKTKMAGNKADLTVNYSVKSMKKVIGSFIPTMNGVFYNFDGSIIPW